MNKNECLVYKKNTTVLYMMNYFNHKNTEVQKLKWVKLLLMNAANSSDTNPTKVPSIPVHVENSMEDLFEQKYLGK